MWIKKVTSQKVVANIEGRATILETPPLGESGA